MEYFIEINQLIVGLIHKLCERKQHEHLVECFNNKANKNVVNSDSTSANSNFFKFIVINDRKFSLNNHKHSKSVYYNLASISTPPKKPKLQRSNTFDWSDRSSVIELESDGLVEKKETNGKNNKLANFLFNSSSLVQMSRKGSNLLNFIINDLNCNNSIRKYIFNKIVGNPIAISTTNSTNESLNGFKFRRFKNGNDIRQFWKKIISEQIILSKMEKEHRKMNLKANYLRDRQHVDERRLADKYNLNYVEITPCLKEVDKIWTKWLDEKASRVELKEIRYKTF